MHLLDCANLVNPSVTVIEAVEGVIVALGKLFVRRISFNAFSNAFVLSSRVANSRWRLSATSAASYSLRFRLLVQIKPNLT
jgi:hypothetical protein